MINFWPYEMLDYPDGLIVRQFLGQNTISFRLRCSPHPNKLVYIRSGRFYYLFLKNVDLQFTFKFILILKIRPQKTDKISHHRKKDDETYPQWRTLPNFQIWRVLGPGLANFRIYLKSSGVALFIDNFI